MVTIVSDKHPAGRFDTQSIYPLAFVRNKSIPRAGLARLSNAGGEMIASLDAESDFQRKIMKKVQRN